MKLSFLIQPPNSLYQTGGNGIDITARYRETVVINNTVIVIII